MDYQKIKKNNKILCVNCQLEFDQESDYLAHYHSEIHRYNVKRKLVGLQPLSMNEYSLSIFFEEFRVSRRQKLQKLCHIRVLLLDMLQEVFEQWNI